MNAQPPLSHTSSHNAPDSIGRFSIQPWLRSWSNQGSQLGLGDRSTSKSQFRPLLVVTVGVATLGSAIPGAAYELVDGRAMDSTMLNRPAIQLVAPTVASPPLFISQSVGDTLQIEDSGDAVSNLQSQLAALGYFSGEITGYFGSQTEAAVIRFQQDNGLEADGVAGPATQAALDSRTQSGGTGSPSTSTPDDGFLQLNDTGDRVIALQTRLRALNYYTGPISGTFGPLTEEAVIRFQQVNGLVADGIVGPTTQTTLAQAAPAPAPTPSPAPPVTPTPPVTPVPPIITPSPSPSGTLRRGDSGPDVAALQRRLRELRYYNGVETGVFDEATETAVINFQRDRGLTADGIVGSGTATALNSAAAIPTIVGGRFSVLELQERLRDRGLYNGPIDGTLNAETRTAIEAAQREFNLTQGDILNGRI